VWGIIPAAGAGSRIQPLAFSKELLPVGTRVDNGVERPRAVSEYLVERMIVAGADKLCFVISPAKTDILQYYGARLWGADIAYVVQPAPGGLCDAIFRAVPFVHAAEPVLIGLPSGVREYYGRGCPRRESRGAAPFHSRIYMPVFRRTHGGSHRKTPGSVPVVDRSRLLEIRCASFSSNGPGLGMTQICTPAVNGTWHFTIATSCREMKIQRQDGVSCQSMNGASIGMDAPS